MNTTADLGKAPIRTLVLQLAIPSMTAQFVNVLYSIIDRMYIGHIAGIGASALTGVGLFTPILMLINAFAMLAPQIGTKKGAAFRHALICSISA